MFCENCNCPSCKAQQKIKCMGSCGYTYLRSELNEYERCVPCEKEHEDWQKSVERSSVHGEWTRSTKVEGIGHEIDFLQPLKRDGTINPHFVEKHGTKKIQKEMKLKKDQILRNIERPKSTARELAAENGYG